MVAQSDANRVHTLSLRTTSRDCALIPVLKPVMAIIALPNREPASRRSLHIRRAGTGRRCTLRGMGEIAPAISVHPAAIGHGARRRWGRRRRGSCVFLINIVRRLPGLVPVMMPVPRHMMTMRGGVVLGRAMRVGRGRLFGLCRLGRGMGLLFRGSRRYGQRNGQSGCCGEEQGFHLVVLLECPVFLKAVPG
jgi:hypothetical protein